MKRIIIYSNTVSPRLKYVCSFIFNEVFEKSILLTSNVDEIIHGEIVINYSTRNIHGSLAICPAGLLDDAGIRAQDLQVKWENEFPLLFSVNHGELSFDPFSAIFYLLTRYEEHLPSEKDSYNRFPASQSIAAKHNFLHLPVVNIWIQLLAQKLAEFYPHFTIPEPKASYLPTIDIDNPWAILHKSFIKTAGGFLKDILFLRSKKVKQRIRVLQKREKDPFHSYPRIEKLHDQNLRIFFLVNSQGNRNNPVPPNNPSWKELIEKLSKQHKIGIHPSYYSVEKPELVAKEKEYLEAITGQQINASRQHFLKMKIPETYRNLITNRISEDYTMGYAEIAGFRAGTSFPYLFYDLEREEATSLRIFPFTLMDRTLKDYMGLSINQAKELISDRIAIIQKYGGVFIPVWHNESLGTADEWAGWSEVYEFMVEEMKTRIFVNYG